MMAHKVSFGSPHPYTSNSSHTPSPQKPRFCSVSNDDENKFVNENKSKEIQNDDMMKIPTEQINLKRFLNARDWWEASTATIPRPLGSAFGKSKSLLTQINPQVVEADEFLELSRPSSRLNTRYEWITSDEASFAEVCQEISERYNQSIQNFQSPDQEEEFKKEMNPERYHKSVKESLLPSGFKTPPRKLFVKKFQTYRSEESPCSSFDSRSRSSSCSPFSSKTSSGSSYPRQTPLPRNVKDSRRSSEEDENYIPGYYFRSYEDSC
ncbi:hypothetical protein DFH28DRAFT_969966 [Melampsora americana]|nr:hypothetical protein DFH28DRAFT_969966 [Melampsora americana]